MSSLPSSIAWLLAIVLAMLSGADSNLLAADDSVSWSDELCVNHVSFDPSKADAKKVRDTVHLLFDAADLQAPILSAPLDPQSVAKLDPNKLDRDCANTLALTLQLDLLPLDGIEDYRRAIVAETKDWCEFEATRIRGYDNPSALLEYKPAAACETYVDAMEGRTDTLAVFRETVEKNCARNAAPALCTQRQLAVLQKADGLERAKLYLMSFGWSNCAIRQAPRNANAATMKNMRDELERLFRQAFDVSKSECDAPQDGHLEFGPTATFETNIAPGTPASRWNVVSFGLFCGSGQLYPGRIVGYVYGIGDDRLSSGEPLKATISLSNKPFQVDLQPYADVALTPLDADFVRDLLQARTAWVQIRFYNSPYPDYIKLEGAEEKLKSALNACYKFP